MTTERQRTGLGTAGNASTRPWTTSAVRSTRRGAVAPKGVVIYSTRLAALSSFSRSAAFSSTDSSKGITLIPSRSECILVPFFRRMQTRPRPSRPEK